MSTLGTKEKVLLVDGNNVVHAWKDLADLLRGNRNLARLELCKRLTSYQDIADFARVVVVFDGRGSKIQEESIPKGIQVFYSDSKRTADDVIERFVHKYATIYSLIVATDDVMEQDAVIAAGAEAISTNALLQSVNQAESQFRSRWQL
tara:strand:- start:8127 stop:8570 length:444 start_codon:yes stop_codon:yes gene_type:complete